MTLDLEQHMRREMVRGLVQRAIFCPVTGDVLDMRTCVVFVDTDGDPVSVVTQEGYRILRTEHPDRIATLTERGYVVDVATVKP